VLATRRDAVVLGIIGVSLLALGAKGGPGGGSQAPCTIAAYPGRTNMYDGPTCSGNACASNTNWFKRDQSDFCGPGTSMKTCQTTRDPLGPFTYAVWSGGTCVDGHCTIDSATHVNTISCDLFIFSAREPCDAED
jgi:hypothetical protein